MRLPFTLTEHDGIARRGFPITGGLPLPRGVAMDPERLVLRDAADARLPLQAEATSHWPDGSLRWVLLDFQADLDLGETRSFILETGEPSPTGPVLEPPRVADGEPLPCLEGGAMRGSRLRLVDAQGREWRAQPGPTTVERRGSLHDTICTRGQLVSPEGDRTVHWESYIDGYRGARWHQVRFVYWADAADVSFIPRPKSAPKPLEFAEFALVIDLAPGGGPLRRDCARSLWTGGRAGPLTADQPLVHLQLDEQAWRTADAQGNVLDAGLDKSEGYLGCRRGEAEGVGVGLAEIWQSHPKALRATEEGLEIALWPRECAAPLRILPGAGRAHTLYLTPYREAGELREFVLGMASPILPRLGTDDLNRCGVLAPQLSLDGTPIPMTERLVEAMFPGFLTYSNADNMGAWGTGEWNWGDFRAPLYEDRRMPIGHGSGAIWANGEAQAGFGMLVQYLRTGRLDCLTMGLACARHKAGVDTVHAARHDWQVGAQHIHSHDHATGQCVSCHVWTSELALAWFLTGDPWLRSVLARTSRHLMLTNREADPLCFRERSGGWLLIALCACYEGLGDPQCLELARRVAVGLKHWIEDDQGRIAIPPARTAHAPSHVFIAMTGLADLWRLTDDPLAKDALLAGGRLVMERGRDAGGFFTCVDAPGYRVYSQVPRWPQAQSLAALEALYRLTGDPQWIDVGLHQCRLLFRLTAAETGWRDEPSWPHAGGLIYAYAFGFLQAAREAGRLTDLL